MTFDTTIDPILQTPAAAQRGRADCSDLTSDRLIRQPHVHRRDYDAEGRRVRRTVGSTTAYYVYGADGQLMAEYGGTPSPVGTQYLVPDHLGSTRLILNAQGGCAQRLDYAPYGAQLTRPGADCYTTPATGLPLFTGQIRDPESAAGTETGLDYFNARYFWATLGRFTSPDAPFADQYPEDPQSWNLFGYVRNNPLRFIDLGGVGGVGSA